MGKLKELIAKYKPKRWYSWQTTLGLSAVSGLMSILAALLGRENGFVTTLLAYFGWLFLIVGISWVVKEERSTWAPWITGAVFCVFIFGFWSLDDWSIAIIIWPIVSAAVYTLPYFWNESLKWKVPDTKERISIFVVFGTQLLLSFWIQFFMVMSDFIQEYPSFYSDDLSESLFIVRTPNRVTQEPRGVFVLDSFATELSTHYGDKRWSDVRQALGRPERFSEQIAIRFEEMQSKRVSLLEDEYWTLLPPLTEAKGAESYILTLDYDWDGAQAKLDEDYRVVKTCEFTPRPRPDNQRDLPRLTQVICQQSEVSGWLKLEADGEE